MMHLCSKFGDLCSEQWSLNVMSGGGAGPAFQRFFANILQVDYEERLQTLLVWTRTGWAREAMIVHAANHFDLQPALQQLDIQAPDGWPPFEPESDESKR